MNLPSKVDLLFLSTLKKYILQRFLKILKRTVLVLALLLLVLYGLLHLTVVQNYIITKVTKVLSKELNTTITIDHVEFKFYNQLSLQSLLIKDVKKDTLLYAGSANIKITDWFFVKDNIVLHYIGLDNVTVNLNRTDSIWNYQFIVDYFDSPKKSNKKSSLLLDLKEIQLSNINFKQIDGWKGQDMAIALKKCSLFADKIDLPKKNIAIKSIQIIQPVYSMNDYTGLRDKLGLTPINIILPPIPGKLQWNKNGWIVDVQNIELQNGTFKNDKETPDRPAYTDHFDGLHLSFGQINGTLQKVHFEKDTVTTFAQLSSTEKSGFAIKKLQANIKFTPAIMEFNALELLTNKSRLGNYFAMHYVNFQDDMGQFLHKVKLDGQFINSEIHSDDIAFFAPELKAWKRTMQVNGIASGSIDNLTAKKMVLKSGNTFIDGSLSIKGLPDIDNTFIDFTSNNLTTNFTEVSSIIPSLKQITQPNLHKLGNIKYVGKFTGLINDFVAFGTINTALGTVVADINLKLPSNKPAIYLGKISTNQFNIGAFIENKNVQYISCNGTVKGSGFSLKNIDANFDGTVKQINVAGYNYQNIAIKGNFKKKLFEGNASIKDPNLNIDYLKGSIDLNGTVPLFNFTAKLNKADFKKLQLTKDDYQLNGNFNLKFSGKNIDEFLGTAKITEAQLLHNSQPLKFDSLILQSTIINQQKYLTLHSNEIDASVIGTFKILALPNAFQIFLSKYFPAYIKKPSTNIGDQDFTFDIKTKQIDEYIQLLDKKLKGFDNSTIKGNLKLKTNELNFTANVPQFEYDKKVFSETVLESTGNLDSLQTNVQVLDITINDSLHLPATNVSINSFNDVSNIKITTSATKALSGAAINANINTYSNGILVHFFPSSFIVNEKKWDLETDGEIAIRNNEITANNITFVQGNQQIKIFTEPSGNMDNKNDVVVALTKVNADDFVPFFLTDPKLEGLVTGKATIQDPFGKPFIDYEATVTDFKTDEKIVGNVQSKGTFDAASGILKFNANSDGAINQFNVDGYINVKDSTLNQTKITIQSDKLDLSFLNTYLGDIFSDISGTANTQNLELVGNNGHLTFNGTAHVLTGALKVKFTQCKYFLNNTTINFKPDEIDFGNTIVKDTFNNTATVSGKMYHHFFKDIEFDNVHFTTNKLLLLNTTKKDNSRFFGKVIGKGSMKLNGFAENMVMDIAGEPSATDSSQIYIISSNSIENGTIDYIDFIEFGRKMEDDYSNALSSNLLVNMALTANPSCKIDVILDEATGDVIKGQGNGLLNIRVGSNEDLSINGRYDITKGEYKFNFQTFLQKYFTVTSGSSIVWSGNPYEAKIDILAEYNATSVDFSNLATGNNSFLQKSDLKIVSHLTETLLKPAIQFEFQLPDASPLKSNFDVINRMAQFQQDKNDLNKQVTSILLFNQFINNNQGFITTGGGYNVLANTIGGVVSNAVSGYFNKLLQKLAPNLSFDFGINSSISSSGADLQNNVQRLQAALKGNLIYKLLNGRLIITVGVNVDYNNPYANLVKNNNWFVTPDATAEWVLSKDGRLRVVAFNRTNVDVVGQRNRTGASLSYRKDANTFGELFIRKKKKK